MSSLQAHERIPLRSREKNEEKAFQANGEMPENSTTSGHGRGRGAFRGRGRDRGQGRGQGRSHGIGGFNQERQNETFQCDYCNNVGHTKVFCWQKKKEENNRANFVEKTVEDSKLFMAHISRRKNPMMFDFGQRVFQSYV